MGEADRGGDDLFVDGSTPGSAVITAQSWNFEDGSTDLGTPATHAFPASGTYDVTLTVTDANGLPASASQPVSAAANHDVSGGPTSAVTLGRA